MTAITTDRIRKSAPLTPKEYKELVKWVKTQPTKVDAALVLGITRQTLDRILIVKSSSPETLEKIKKALPAGKSKA